MSTKTMPWVAFAERYNDIHLVIQRTLRKYFYRFCVHDAYEDLVQESMTVVYEAWADGRIRDPQNLLNFTASVAFYTGCRVVPKYRKLPEQIDESYHFADRGQSPEEILMEKERGDQISRGIQALSNALDRELLQRCFDGEKAHETRDSMQLTPGQFRNRKSRALKSLSNQVHKQRTGGMRTPALSRRNEEVYQTHA